MQTIFKAAVLAAVLFSANAANAGVMPAADSQEEASKWKEQSVENSKANEHEKAEASKVFSGDNTHRKKGNAGRKNKPQT